MKKGPPTAKEKQQQEPAKHLSAIATVMIVRRLKT